MLKDIKMQFNQNDKEFLKNKSKIKNVHEFLEKANDEITDFVKDQTNDLLDKTLFTASCEMKNGFSRSDAEKTLKNIKLPSEMTAFFMLRYILLISCLNFYLN